MSKKPKHELENNKLQKRLRHAVGDAINDFNMIENGDKIMVCLSGGKDSYALLDILRQLQASAPIEFELVAVNLDQKQPGFPEHVLPEYLSSIGVPYKIVEEDTYSTVKRVLDEGKTTCSLCSRLRRGILYRTAKELGCTKIALGHHRDDIIATLFLNMFYGGKLKAMPPKLVSDNGEHIVIRPLAYVKEKDLIKYAELKQFPIIPCNLCGSQPNLQRQVIGDMLKDWDKRFPGRIESMFSALQNVVPSHLADTDLFDFAGLQRGQKLKHGGDLAFDSETMSFTAPRDEDDGQPEKPAQQPFKQSKQRKRQHKTQQHLPQATQRFKRQRHHSVIRRNAVSLGRFKPFVVHIQLKRVRRKRLQAEVFAVFIVCHISLAHRRFIALPAIKRNRQHLARRVAHQNEKARMNFAALRVWLGGQMAENQHQREHQRIPCDDVGGGVEQFEQGGGKQGAWGHFQAALTGATAVSLVFAACKAAWARLICWMMRSRSKAQVIWQTLLNMMAVFATMLVLSALSNSGAMIVIKLVIEAPCAPCIA